MELSAPPKDLNEGFWYFGNRRCPFAHRAWWSALEKKFGDFRYVHIDLGDNKPEWYQKELNPLGSTPCVYNNGQGVFDSLIVCEFLEDNWKGQGVDLLPSDPAQRAIVRLLASQLNTSPFFGILGAGSQKERDECAQKCDEALKTFNDLAKRVVPNPQGPYLYGAFSLADIANFTLIDRFIPVLKHYRNYDLQLEKYDRIHSAYEAVKTHDAFKTTAQPADFYIKSFESKVNSSL